MCHIPEDQNSNSHIYILSFWQKLTGNILKMIIPYKHCSNEGEMFAHKQQNGYSG
jgi:hypothetical protein